MSFGLAHREMVNPSVSPLIPTHIRHPWHINVQKVLRSADERLYPKRVVDVSVYVVKTSATVRQAATVFGVSKSTVHKDVTERLRINKELAQQVKEVWAE